MERFPEIRLDSELAQLVDARLAEGQTWSSLVREALQAYLSGARTSRPRRRRPGPVAKALTVSLNAVLFQDRDAGAVGLAKSLAERIDEHPSDAKYLSARLLATLVELRMTPAARAGVFGAATDMPVDASLLPSKLERLRLTVQARAAGIPGLVTYLSHRDRLDDETWDRFGAALSPQKRVLVETITRNLDELEGVPV